MDDPIKEGDDELRLDAPAGQTARVVLAEREAPGPLHYLLEAEGFQVVGCADDEVELARVLEQDVAADVIVLDQDIIASAAQVAIQHEPKALVIVIWPDGVQPLVGTERVAPWLVYEKLGPTIRRAMRERRLRPDPVEATPEPEPVVVLAAPTVPRQQVRRAAARVSVTTLVLIAAIVLTMGVSFALEGWQLRQREALLPWSSSAQPTVAVSHPTASPAGGRPAHGRPAHSTAPCVATGSGGRRSPNEHASSEAQQTHGRACASGGGTAHRPDHPTTPAHPHTPAHPPRTQTHTHGHGGGTANGGGSGGHSGSTSGGGTTSTDHGPQSHPTGPPSTSDSTAHGPSDEHPGQG